MGDWEIWKLGHSEIGKLEIRTLGDWGLDDWEIRRLDKIRRLVDKEISRLGDWKIRRLGNLEIGRLGDLEI